MKAITYLESLPREWIPKNVERGIHSPSNGDLKRWLNMGAIVINGLTPKANDEISFLIKELVFFPNGKRKVTMV